MPKRNRSRGFGASSLLGFTSTTLGFPSQQEKALLGFGEASVKFAGVQVTGTFNLESLTDLISLSPTDLQRLVAAGVATYEGTVAPSLSNSVAAEITKVTTVVEEVVETVPIVEQSKLDVAYDKFVEPFLKTGPLTIGSNSAYAETYLYFNALIQANEATSKFNYLARDTMKVVVEGRNQHMENLRLSTEIKFLKERYEESLCRIQKLMAEVAEHDLGDGNYLAGSLGVKIKQPKPLIYAQALFNPILAWYIYMYGTAKIEPAEYQAVVTYVQSLGTPADATAKLHELLDEKFRNLEKDLHLLPAPTSSESCTGSSDITSSCPDTSSGVCTSDSSQGHVSDCPYDSDDYFNPDDYIHPGDLLLAAKKTAMYMAPPDGSKGDMLILPGMVNIIKTVRVNEDESDRMNRKRMKMITEGKKVKPTGPVYVDLPWAEKEGFRDALVLTGNVNTRLDERVRPPVRRPTGELKKTARKKKRKYHKKTVNRRELPYGPLGPKVFVIPGSVKLVVTKRVNDIPSEDGSKLTREQRKAIRKDKKNRVLPTGEIGPGVFVTGGTMKMVRDPRFTGCG